MAPRAGLEPATCWFEARRSIQLSYRGARLNIYAQYYTELAQFIQVFMKICGKLQQEDFADQDGGLDDL